MSCSFGGPSSDGVVSSAYGMDESPNDSRHHLVNCIHGYPTGELGELSVPLDIS